MVFHVSAIHVQQGQNLEILPREYPARLPPGAPRSCSSPGCGRALPEGARRHRCARCSVRATRGTLAEGPCEACGLADPRVLRRLTLRDGTVTACACCASVAGRRPLTLSELRGEVAGAPWGSTAAA